MTVDASVAAAAVSAGGAVLAAVGGWVLSTRAQRENALAQQKAHELAQKAERAEELQAVMDGQAAFIDRLQAEVAAKDRRLQACERREREALERERAAINDREALRMIVSAEVQQEANRRWPTDPEERRTGADRRRPHAP